MFSGFRDFDSQGLELDFKSPRPAFQRTGFGVPTLNALYLKQSLRQTPDPARQAPS